MNSYQHKVRLINIQDCNVKDFLGVPRLTKSYSILVKQLSNLFMKNNWCRFFLIGTLSTRSAKLKGESQLIIIISCIAQLIALETVHNDVVMGSFRVKSVVQFISIFDICKKNLHHLEDQRRSLPIQCFEILSNQIQSLSDNIPWHLYELISTGYNLSPNT